jgi:hypothetical protein
MRLDEDHPAAVAWGAWIGSASRQAGLPGPLRELHRAVLRRFLQTGHPPAAGWVAGAAAGLGLSGSAVADLEAADLVHAANGVVSVAYPFSGTPTRQQVELDGFPAVLEPHTHPARSTSGRWRS